MADDRFAPEIAGDYEIKAGIDFGAPDKTTVVYYDTKELIRFIETYTLVNDGMRVVTSSPSLQLTKFQLEFYHRLVAKMFWKPKKFPSVRKGRRRTRRS